MPLLKDGIILFTENVWSLLFLRAFTDVYVWMYAVYVCVSSDGLELKYTHFLCLENTGIVKK